VLLYIHGGAFMLCSKETHHGIALAHASRADYLVFNIDYRLAPHFKFRRRMKTRAVRLPGSRRTVRAMAAIRAHRRRRRIGRRQPGVGGCRRIGLRTAGALGRREVFDCGRAAGGSRAPDAVPAGLQSDATGAHPAGSWLAVNVAEDIAQSYLGVGRLQATRKR